MTGNRPLYLSLTKITKTPRFVTGAAAIGPNGRPFRQPFWRYRSTYSFVGLIMRTSMDRTGFTPPSGRPLGRERRTTTIAELVATIALALCTLVAATAVSVGIARANVVSNVVGHEASLFGIALMLGLLFVVMGGLTALPPGPRKSRRG